MLAQRPQRGRTAILSFQSHGDRSFLDDRVLALVSGELSAQGFANDLVLTVLDADAGRGESEAEQRLVQCLRDYDLVIYERVWSRELIAWLRTALPEVVFVSCRGEHVLDDPPADFTLNGDLQACVPAFVGWIRGQAPLPLFGTKVREGQRFVEPNDVGSASASSNAYAPNLRPRFVNPDALPKSRTFSVVGNKGCAFQSDARENPLYRGVEIPRRYGRGCAFCTTGNEYLPRPNAETAAEVLEQIRFIRTNAPELDTLVLKD